MAQMQYLGELKKRNELSQVAQALSTVMGGVESRREREEEREGRQWERGQKEKEYGLVERRVGVQEETLKQNLRAMDYKKKKATADMVTSVAKQLDRDAAEDFVSQPQVRALFEDLGWPLPTGLHEEKSAKDQALEAVSRGEALPGMTEDETRKLAGVLVSKPAITRDVIKSAPWQLADILPWAESEKERLERVRRERVIGAPTSPRSSSDPLGVRK